MDSHAGNIVVHTKDSAPDVEMKIRMTDCESKKSMSGISHAFMLPSLC